MHIIKNVNRYNFGYGTVLAIVRCREANKK